MPKKVTYWAYIKKSTFWYIGNFAFGVIPILFMCLVYVISRHKVGFEDMDKLTLTSIFVAGFSVCYCIINRTFLLIKENDHHE